MLASVTTGMTLSYNFEDTLQRSCIPGTTDTAHTRTACYISVFSFSDFVHPGVFVAYGSRLYDSRYLQLTVGR